ncbi:hypothetical protein THAOC_08256 [Thalassiosira oceanica]|uniref:Uncharacterized protein n=1 Tax=Thalassiosira oceanica TaxID=159749 RepID=K0SYB7_THAOC|nr:hypothetical protein THAOC_08256 [Thalassiosira oceanica]|eukprot:EJK70390.1 hypothetical protein THAOC_08256 [Thalassiosira oceanica]
MSLNGLAQTSPQRLNVRKEALQNMACILYSPTPSAMRGDEAVRGEYNLIDFASCVISGHVYRTTRDTSTGVTHRPPRARGTDDLDHPVSGSVGQSQTGAFVSRRREGHPRCEGVASRLGEPSST